MKNIEIIKIFLTIFLFSLSALIFSEDSEECRRDKPFIDLWDTICPDDWVPYPSNDETSGSYYAPRSRIQIPKEATKAADIDSVIIWIWDYDEDGFFGSDVKAFWTNYFIECNKNRFVITDMHGFSDITAKNRILRETSKGYNDVDWLPITFKETEERKMNLHVLHACNLI